jgi:Cu/Ag efflux pump CusA
MEIEMAGLPGMVELRSLSKFGLSQITMTFATAPTSTDCANS